MESYEPDDGLYLFGLSRGAFGVRGPAGLSGDSGILRRDHVDRTREAGRCIAAGSNGPPAPGVPRHRAERPGGRRLPCAGRRRGALGVPPGPVASADDVGFQSAPDQHGSRHRTVGSP
ncbi:phospholipase effector Tle1 domain-containing protein [Streptomyces sp. NRRL S-37]|uniref:phospholipase effector Tle1 domain-containing protein n=1 Tax=Streptomyces sp. NRRL S-37 TaxID=1463903 RepID=UPI002D2193A5|nr:DUF2235 domain-containing protein [Streptomyces sp. NRRL S-37]